MSATIDLEITCADPATFISELSTTGIMLQNVRYKDVLVVVATVYRKDMDRIMQYANKKGNRVRIIGNAGFYYTFRRILRRPVLLSGILLWCMIALFLPTRVLFVEVEGTNLVSAYTVIDKAQECGIHFGASRRAVRSEKVKNALLSAIPQLEWVGVNTYGCVAVITVRERTAAQEQKDNGPCSIIAARDGVICQMVVTSGNALCHVGQAVEKGQLIVSPYTDCGRVVKVSRAQAEIHALTVRNFQAVTLSDYTLRTQSRTVKRRYGLKIGKNIINFYKDSGISDTRCAKIYAQRSLVLPGGFALPVSLIEQTVICYDLERATHDEAVCLRMMQDRAKQYLHSTMVAGQILNTRINGGYADGCYQIEGVYFCREMIGCQRREEIFQNDG